MYKARCIYLYIYSGAAWPMCKALEPHWSAGDKNKSPSWLAYHVKTEVPSTLTLRVEVKEPTDDVKHSGSDHRQGISAPIFLTLSLLRHLRERNK